MKWIKLKTIELHNYRQFKDEKVDFSLDDKTPFTIIEGKNGFGKSNILNALTWCFYGVEQHLKHAKDEEAEPIINTREITNMNDGDRINATVIVRLSTDEGEIKIERTIWGRKSGGKFYLEDRDSFQIMQQNNKGNWEQSVYPTYVINRILPQIVMRFFFFDGEQLRQFFENISQEDVKNAIFDISQVSLIDLAISNLNKVLSDYRAEDKSDDPRLQELKDDIEFFKKNIEDLPNKIKEIEIQKKEAKKNIATIESELRSSSIEVVKELQKERDEVNDVINSDLERLNELEEEFKGCIMETAPVVFSKKAMNTSLDILSRLQMEGILPPKIEDTFVRELLDVKKKCICGTDLSSGEARETLLRLLKDRKIKEGVSNEANELKYDLKHLIKKVSSFDDKARSLSKKIMELNERIKTKKGELIEISAKIKKHGDFSKEDIENKEREKEGLDEAVEDATEKITALKIKIEDFKEKRKKAEKDYDSLSRDLIKNKKILKKREFLKRSIEVLSNIKKKLIDELRLEIEKNTKESFTKIVSSKKFKEIKIDENYRIYVIKESGYNTLKSLSVGETLLLGLSFMAALRKVSGFFAPVVIDTPLAPIDKEYRENLIDFMSSALKETQIVLLAKDTEYTDNVKHKLNPKTGLKKLLKHDKLTGLTQVVPYE